MVVEHLSKNLLVLRERYRESKESLLVFRETLQLYIGRGGWRDRAKSPCWYSERHYNYI